MRKGFTLIELLIVIGILAILATTVVLVLNPAQILRETRDTQRISDLSSVQSAIGLMLATDPTIPTFTAGPFCTVAGCTIGAVAPFTCAGFTLTGCAVNTIRLVNGTGWVGIDLGGTSGGAPISTLPIDPNNNATHHYAYAGSDANKTYELNGRFESDKIGVNAQNDGGEDNACGCTGGVCATLTAPGCWYEIGTTLGL